MSLRQKLVLLSSALSLAVLAVAGTFAYQDVRQSARLTADERLNRVVAQLSELIATGAQDRLRLKEEVNMDPGLRAILRGEPADTQALVESLGRLREASDAGLPVQVWDRSRRTLLSDLAVDETLDRSGAPLDTVPTYGFFRPVGDEVHYWSTAPIRSEDGDVLGWTVQQRRIGNPVTAARLERLVGDGSRIVLAVPEEGAAFTLAGRPTALPPTGVPTGSLLSYDRDGRSYFARASTVVGSPWTLFVEMPTSVMEARPQAFLRNIAAVGLALLLITVAVAWLLGRHITRPIEELMAASEAMARGDDPRPLSAADGGDELGRLARAFDAMAAKVKKNQDELKRRLREEQRLGRMLREANVEAERARREAEKANRAKSKFLAMMSHEVRTPINAVLGYCDLLDTGVSGRLSPEQQQYVDRIRRSSRLLGTLVEDVLDFSHLESGRLRIESRPFRVLDTAESAVSALEPRAAEKGLSLEIDVPPDLCSQSDPDRVEQILMNLLSNAVKFTERGGVTVRARPDRSPEEADASASGDGRRIRIEVRDTGPGIGAEERKRIFEPFVQGDMTLTRRHGGTGLGLSISRELSRRMGGDLTVEDGAAVGACFVLHLPEAARVRAG